MNVEVKASKVINRVAIETGFPCITTIYRCKKVKEERGGVRFFGEGHLGLIFWPRGSLLILGRAPIGAWALTRGNTVFAISLVKTFFI